MMKTVLVQRLSDISDVDLSKNSNDPIYTRDGGKLVTLRITSENPAECITKTLAILLNAIPDSDRTVYVFYGNLNISVNECVYSMVVGVSGMNNLDEVLKDVMAPKPLVDGQPVQPDLPGINDENTYVDTSEEEAVIVKE